VGEAAFLDGGPPGARSPRRSPDQAGGVRLASRARSAACTLRRLRHLGWQRQPHPDRRAVRRRRRDQAFAAQFPGPLAHRAQPDAAPDRRTQAHAVVHDLHHQVRPAPDPHPAGPRARVPGHVRQGLRDDPVRRHLHRRRQPVQPLPGGQRHLQLLRVEAAALRGQPLPQTPVQHGRAQLIDQLPGLRQACLQVTPQRGEHLRRPAARLDQPVCRQQLHRHARQRRTDTVVQIPPQPPPLLLPGHHQPLPRIAQIFDQAHRVRRRGRLQRHLRQQLALPRGEPAARRPRRHQQPTDRLTPRQHRELRRAVTAPAVLRDHHRPLPDPDLHRHVRHPQRSGDRLHHRRQQVARIHRAADQVTHPGQHPVRIVPVAVDQPVHAPSRPLAQRRHRGHPQQGRRPWIQLPVDVGQ